MKGNQLRNRLTILSISILLLGVGIGLAAGPTAAQVSLPAEYYGNVSTADGELPGTIEIEVVANGEVEDSVVTEADGSFGGPTAASQVTRLAVQGNSSTTVAFQIGGEPVEIATLNGESINQESIQWNNDVINEIELVAEADQVTPEVDVEITEAPSSVDAGEEITVAVSLENQGSVGPTDDVQLVTSDGEPRDSSAVTLGIGESANTTLSWTTTEEDAGEQTLDVEFAGSSDSTTVTVEGTNETEDDGSGGGGAGGGGGGGAGGGGGGAGDGDTTDDQPATTQEIRDSLNLIEPETSNETTLQDAKTEDTGLTVVPEATSVQQIVFTNENLNGTVSVTEYGTPPESISTDIRSSIAADVGISDGGLSILSVTDISPTVAATEDSSATVTLNVDRSRVNQPETLTVFKESYSEEAQTDRWAELETNITETTDQTITIEAEVESFSLFTVAEVTSTANSTDGQNETSTDSEEEPETNDGIPGFGPVVALVSLVSAAIVAARKA